jgi:DNA-binding winged helix-turn-helix (wHTH) protein/TolB-like protein/Tfp pilus assembly protein PilF
MGQSNQNIYEFGDFRLIPAEGLLLKNGQPISLTPKAFSTLLLLVEQHGHLVEKAVLIDRVWENSFVEEAAVSRCVWAIRNALGEDTARKFIQTVPKRGYRFVADVSTTADAAFPGNEKTNGFTPSSNGHNGTNGAVVHLQNEFENAPANLADPSAAKVELTTGPKRIFRMAAACLLAVGIIATYLYVVPRSNQKPRLAVLPLQPVNVEERDRRLELAVADSLIAKIGNSRGFTLSQLSAVRKFADLDEDPVKAGRDLNVDYVLASNYQVADGRIRVTSQLINVGTGDVEQTFRADTDAANIFALRDAVANQIGDAVFAKFGMPATRYTAFRGTENEKAFNLFYEALYIIDKNTKEDSVKAAQLLAEAVALDPSYAQAWALQAQAYCFFAHQGGGVPDEVFKIAEPMLERALSLDHDNGVAFTVRGTLNRDYHWNFDQAYKDLDRAIKVDPNYLMPHRILAGLYYRDRRFAEAVEEQKKAVEISPTSVVDKWFLGSYLAASGRKDEGIAQLYRVAEMNPSFTPVYSSLWENYHQEGNHAKAYESFMKLKEVSGTEPDLIAKYKDAYERSGWMGVLRTELSLTKSKDPVGEYSARKYYIACLAALVGEKDTAFDYLNETLRYRSLGISFLKADAKLDSLRDDPRFDDLLRRAGLVATSKPSLA